MSDLPDPLTPADCDLRGMPYMAFDIVRLFDSDFYALSTGDEFKAGFTLWGKAFLQRPAGSLPDDDRILEHLSGSKRWKAVREMAMRGWFRCSDGRLYHRTVAEKVLEAWASRIARRERTEAARAARHKSTSTVTEKATEHATDDATVSVTEVATGSKGTEQNRTENKKEETVANAPAKKVAERGSRLPADWQPSEADATYATDLGLDLTRVTADFTAYWHAKAGQGATKLDWSLTWQSWCRRAADMQGKPKAQPSNWRGDAAENNARRLAELDAELAPEAPEDLFAGTTIEGVSEDV